MTPTSPTAPAYAAEYKSAGGADHPVDDIVRNVIESLPVPGPAKQAIALDLKENARRSADAHLRKGGATFVVSVSVARPLSLAPT